MWFLLRFTPAAGVDSPGLPPSLPREALQGNRDALVKARDVAQKQPPNAPALPEVRREITDALVSSGVQDDLTAKSMEELIRLANRQIEDLDRLMPLVPQTPIAVKSDLITEDFKVVSDTQDTRKADERDLAGRTMQKAEGEGLGEDPVQALTAALRELAEQHGVNVDASTEVKLLVQKLTRPADGRFSVQDGDTVTDYNHALQHLGLASSDMRNDLANGLLGRLTDASGKKIKDEARYTTDKGLTGVDAIRAGETLQFHLTWQERATARQNFLHLQPDAAVEVLNSPVARAALLASATAEVMNMIQALKPQLSPSALRDIAAVRIDEQVLTLVSDNVNVHAEALLANIDMSGIYQDENKIYHVRVTGDVAGD